MNLINFVISLNFAFAVFQLPLVTSELCNGQNCCSECCIQVDSVPEVTTDFNRGSCQKGCRLEACTGGDKDRASCQAGRDFRNISVPLHHYVFGSTDIQICCTVVSGSSNGLALFDSCDTKSPTLAPTTAFPTESPTFSPTPFPTTSPTHSPTESPTSFPTTSPTVTFAPTSTPTILIASGTPTGVVVVAVVVPLSALSVLIIFLRRRSRTNVVINGSDAPTNSNNGSLIENVKIGLDSEELKHKNNTVGSTIEHVKMRSDSEELKDKNLEQVEKPSKEAKPTFRYMNQLIERSTIPSIFRPSSLYLKLHKRQIQDLKNSNDMKPVTNSLDLEASPQEKFPATSTTEEPINTVKRKKTKRRKVRKGVKQGDTGTTSPENSSSFTPTADPFPHISAISPPSSYTGPEIPFPELKPSEADDKPNVSNGVELPDPFPDNVFTGVPVVIEKGAGEKRSSVARVVVPKKRASILTTNAAEAVRKIKRENTEIRAHPKKEYLEKAISRDSTKSIFCPSPEYLQNSPNIVVTSTTVTKKSQDDIDELDI